MNLNKRERLLAIGVGALVLLFVGQYLFESVRDGYNTKTREIERLTKQKENERLQILAGSMARKRLMTVAKGSLPSSDEIARGAYMEWLVSLGREAGLADPTPRYSGMTKEKGVYQMYQYRLDGVGTVENLTRLLYAFYSKNYLHRISRLDVTPLYNTASVPDQLKIVLECQVLSLEVASPSQPSPESDSNRIAKSLDAYLDVIRDRNLFGATNHAPDLETSKVVEGKKGIPFEYSVEAKDQDPGQWLRYELEGNIPKGLVIDAETGKLRWTSNELGKFDVSIRAKDSGIPSRSTLQKLTINIANPPPPVKEPPKFDVASQAYVSAFVSGGSEGPQAWIRSKTESKTIYLKKGDQLKLGEVVGQVTEIGANYLELETEGKRWLVGQDESLADAYSRSHVD